MTVIDCPYPLSARTKATSRPTIPALQIVSTSKEITVLKCWAQTYPTITILSLELNDAMAGIGKKVVVIQRVENMLNKK